MTDPALIERITRSLAFMLRHRPERFDLEVDSHGYADMDEVIRALNERLGEPVEEEDLERAVTAGNRVRYEIKGDAIRALYGHSIPVEPGPDCEPPDHLYVGIATRDVDRALSHGLRGGRRSYLHLALNEADAIETGRRLAAEYSVLKIQAIDAWEEGTNFYDRRSLFLAEEIPAHQLEVLGSYDDGEDPMPRGERGRGPRGQDAGGRSRGPRGRGRGRERSDEPREPRGRGRDDEEPRGRGRGRERDEPRRPAREAPDRDRDAREERPREERPRAEAVRAEAVRDDAVREDTFREDAGERDSGRVRGRARRERPEPRGGSRDDERPARRPRRGGRAEREEAPGSGQTRSERRPEGGHDERSSERPARPDSAQREERRPRRDERPRDEPRRETPARTERPAAEAAEEPSTGFGLGVFGGQQESPTPEPEVAAPARRPERRPERKAEREPEPAPQRAPEPEPPKPEPEPAEPESSEPDFGAFGSGL